jgi:hypothetical protein
MSQKTGLSRQKAESGWAPAQIEVINQASAELDRAPAQKGEDPC